MPEPRCVCGHVRQRHSAWAGCVVRWNLDRDIQCGCDGWEEPVPDLEAICSTAHPTHVGTTCSLPKGHGMESGHIYFGDNSTIAWGFGWPTLGWKKP